MSYSGANEITLVSFKVIVIRLSYGSSNFEPVELEIFMEAQENII